VRWPSPRPLPRSHRALALRRVSYILNYKRLPYKTVWVGFADVAKVAREIGAPPAATRRTGEPWYALPIIYDPATRTHVATSTAIAAHLDRAYPDTPAVVPRGTETLQAAFEDHFMARVFPHMPPLLMARVCAQLGPRDQVYFRQTRESMFKSTLEELCPPERAPELWGNLRAALAPFLKYLRSTPGAFLAGDEMRFADVMMAGFFVWFKKIYGADSEEWKTMMGWDSALARLMGEMEKWEYTEEDVVAKAR
jgi:glutathione S-transferase